MPIARPVFARTLHESSHGFVWALGTRGAARVRNGCTVPGPALPAVPMRSMVEESDGTSLDWHDGQGLIRFRNGETVSFTASSGMPDNTVNVVFEDREENLWIGCEDGLVRLTRRSGTNIGSQDGLEDDNVLTVYADRQDHLWITTMTGQIYRVSGAAVQRYRLPSPAAELRIRTVFQDRGGAFWFGTFAGGLVRQDGSGCNCLHQGGWIAQQHRSGRFCRIAPVPYGSRWIAA